MCNEEKNQTDLSCQCIHDILEKICRIQKQDFCKEDFAGCDKPFLGPTPTSICYNTRPIQLFNCCSGNLWSFPFTNGEQPSTSTIFRVESLDDCCCTCRILTPIVIDPETGDETCTATNEFFTINLNCVGAIKCLNDTYVDVC